MVDGVSYNSMARGNRLSLLYGFQEEYLSLSPN